jgi:hypothetical protein
MDKLTSTLALLATTATNGLGAALRTIGFGRRTASVTAAPEATRERAQGDMPTGADASSQIRALDLLIEAAAQSADSARSAHDAARLSLDAAEYQLGRLYQEFPDVQALCAAQRAGSSPEADRDAGPATPLAA